MINKQLEDEVMTRSSTESKTSHVVAANLSELELKKILIDKMESNKSIYRSDEQKNLYKALVEAYKSEKLMLNTYEDTVSFKRPRDDEDKDKEPSAGSNRGESAHTKEPMHTDKDLEEPTHQEFDIGATEEQSDEETSQHPDCNLAWEEVPRESFDELMDTPLDFSAFMMNRLKIDTLTPELLADPTFELMKGTCKSLVELEYFFEEVYKATTDQLDWHNPEGKMELENSQNNSLAKLPILKLGEYEMWEIRIKQYFQIQDYALWEVIEYGNSWVPIPITAPESGPSTALKMTVPSTTEEKICKKNDVKAKKDLNVKFLRSLPSEWDTHVEVWMNKPDFDTMGLDDLYNNFKIVEQKVKRTAAANNDDKNLAFLTTSSPSSTNTIMLASK
ncbi:hypothetical protein Tco_0280266 [Tanacetum coccineum]